MRTPVEKHCYFAYSVVIRLSLVCVVAAAVFVVELPPSSLSFTPCVEDPRTLLSRFLPFGLCKHVAAVSSPHSPPFVVLLRIAVSRGILKCPATEMSRHQNMQIRRARERERRRRKTKGLS